MKQAWPGMMRTLKGDHARFEQTYFSTFKVGLPLPACLAFICRLELFPFSVESSKTTYLS